MFRSRLQFHEDKSLAKQEETHGYKTGLRERSLHWGDRLEEIEEGSWEINAFNYYDLEELRY